MDKQVAEEPIRRKRSEGFQEHVLRPWSSHRRLPLGRAVPHNHSLEPLSIFHFCSFSVVDFTCTLAKAAAPSPPSCAINFPMRRRFCSASARSCASCRSKRPFELLLFRITACDWSLQFIIKNACNWNFHFEGMGSHHQPSLHGSSSFSHRRLDTVCSRPPKLLPNSSGCLARVAAKKENAHVSKSIDLICKHTSRVHLNTHSCAQV
jgi:hypothetical protein